VDVIVKEEKVNQHWIYINNQIHGHSVGLTVTHLNFARGAEYDSEMEGIILDEHNIMAESVGAESGPHGRREQVGSA
jgi:hypothetical protein